MKKLILLLPVLLLIGCANPPSNTEAKKLLKETAIQHEGYPVSEIIILDRRFNIIKQKWIYGILIKIKMVRETSQTGTAGEFAQDFIDTANLIYIMSMGYRYEFSIKKTKAGKWECTYEKGIELKKIKYNT